MTTVRVRPPKELPLSTSVLPAPPAIAPAPVSAAPTFRRDIQGLRAVAVGAVVIYHLFPDLLPGGFVGVDVFFVISGYLITGHLVREMRTRGSIDLLGFYARRARRLVPSATVVLALTWLASLFVLPGSRLGSAAQQVVASAVYVQNWVLADDSVDYLTAEDAASPVQHYWSLSVEEQFYLGWPVLLILAGVLARRLRWSWRRTAALLGALACALSLGASVVLTASNGPAAYFVTHTRVWELGLGALLAVVAGQIELPARAARAARWTGLGLIAWAAVLYSGATAFPGTAALVPVVGSLLVLAAGAAAPATRILGAPAMTWVGDHSYALYLVHWPLIVLWKAWSGGEIGALDGPIILTGSLLFAWALTRLVEDPVRRSRALAPRSRGLAISLLAVVPVAMAFSYLPIAAQPRLTEVSSEKYPGAAVLAGDADGVVNSIDTMTPPAESAVEDRSDYYERGCETGIEVPGTVTCDYGQGTDPTLTVAVVGDSKIGQWIPALEALAEQNGWQIVTYLRSRCPWTETRTIVGAGDESPYDNCAAWGQDVLGRLVADPPDLLLTSDRPSVGIPGHPKADAESHGAIAEGMTAYWQQMLDLGTQVVAIRETPEMGTNIPDCLSTPGATMADCSRALDEAVTAHDPTVLATGSMGGVCLSST